VEFKSNALTTPPSWMIDEGFDVVGVYITSDNDWEGYCDPRCSLTMDRYTCTVGIYNNTN
jgi:hypothetical protein